MRQIGTLALVLTLLFLLLAVVFAGDVGGMLRATLVEVPVTIGPSWRSWR